MMDHFALIFINKNNQNFPEIQHHKFYLCERSLFFLLPLSMLIAILEENFFFEYNREFYRIETNQGEYLKVIFNEGESPQYLLFLRILNVLITILMSSILCYRKYSYFKFLKRLYLIPLISVFYKTHLFLELILEIMMFHIQPYPGLDSYYHTNSIRFSSIYYYDSTLTAFLLMIRMLFFIRSMLYLSNFSNAKAMKICFDLGAPSGLLFTLKSEFKSNTQRFVLIFVFFVILFLGILLRINERSFQHLSKFDWDYVWNSFWDIIITVTSVGYGDFYPVSNFGRVIIGIAALGGGIITSLVYIIFFALTSFKSTEENSFRRIKAFESKKAYKEKAMICVGLSLKYFKKMKGKYDEKKKNEIFEDFLVDIQRNVKDFSNLKKIIVDFKFSSKLIGAIDYLQQKLTFDVDHIISYINVVDFMLKKTDILLENTTKMEEFCSNFEDSCSQVLASFNILQQEIISCLEDPLKKTEAPTPKDSYLIDQVVNKSRDSIQRLSLMSNFVRQSSSTDFLNQKISLSKLKKTKFITLKKIPFFKQIIIQNLENHPFHNTKLKRLESVTSSLALHNKNKQQEFNDLIQKNEGRTSMLESQRKSLAYRISLISDSKHSVEDRSPIDKKFIVKRFNKKELSCLEEKGFESEGKDNSSLESVEEESEKGSKFLLNIDNSKKKSLKMGSFLLSSEQKQINIEKKVSKSSQEDIFDIKNRKKRKSSV